MQVELLKAWHAQNPSPYAPGQMGLWVEADTWGNTWRNKASGGYDLTVVSNNKGTKDGNAIVAGSTSSARCHFSVERNVLGTGSFTVEAVVKPSSDMLETTNGG